MSRTTLLAGALAAGALALGASPAHAAGATVHVSPVSGKDTNPGTATAPLRTIGRALDLAKAGDTVRLAGGRYERFTNGEIYTTSFGLPRLQVPSGVTIQGEANAAVGRTVIAGAGTEVGLSLSGDATVSDVLLTGFDRAVQADKGTQLLRGVDVTHSRIKVTDTAKTTYKATVADPRKGERGGIIHDIPGTAVTVAGDARFTMDGGVISGGGANCATGVQGVFSTNSGVTTLRNGARLENLAGGGWIGASGAKFAATDSAFTMNVPSGCAPDPILDSHDFGGVTVERSTFSSNRTGLTTAVRIDGLAKSSVNTSTIDGFSRAGILTGSKLKTLDVLGTTIHNSFVGVNAQASPAAFVNVVLSRLELNGIGIKAGALRMRFSKVAVNSGGGVILNGPLANLGQVGDPGNNTMFNNGAAGSVRFQLGATSGAVLAVGNTWQPNEQGADGAGHYAHQTITGDDALAVGPNFRLPAGPFSSIEL